MSDPSLEKLPNELACEMVQWNLFYHMPTSDLHDSLTCQIVSGPLGADEQCHYWDDSSNNEEE